MTASRLRRIGVTIAFVLALSVCPASAETLPIESQYGSHRYTSRSSGTIPRLFNIAQAELSANQDVLKSGQDQPPPEENGPASVMDDTAFAVAEAPAGQAVAPYDQALVRAIQELLPQHGFEAGPADGIMGPKTTEAIAAYQESVGLQANGRPSRGLLEQLRSQTGNGSTEGGAGTQETVPPEDAIAAPTAVAAPIYEADPLTAPDISLSGTIWNFTDEIGSDFVLEFAPDGAVKGVLYEKFWTWRQAAEEVVILYDNGMGLMVSRTGRMSHAASMLGRAQPSRGEAWTWIAKRIYPPVPDTPPAEQSPLPQPELYPEQPGPLGSSDQVEATPANPDETETSRASDTQPISDIETDLPAPETKPDEVVQTKQPASVPAIVPDAVLPPQAPIISDSENNDQTPSEDGTEQSERKSGEYGENSPDGRIVILAVRESWVEATDIDGKILFSRVLRKGDSYRAPARKGATLVTGNAGGLEIIIDGQPAPALGPVGVVRRGVALDPELLKSGTAWPPGRGNKALPPQPEPYVEQTGPADSLDQVEATPADSVEAETLVAPDRQPVGDIETDPSSSENKPDKVTQTELPASEPPTVSDTVVQPQAPANSDFENNDQAPSGDVLEQAKRKPRVYGEDNPGRIIIRAVEESWVEVTDADGEILFSRVLRKGDSYRAPARKGATLVTGNAGGLEIIIDGQPAPALGPVGVVRRGVALDPELLKLGAAWPPASGR